MSAFGGEADMPWTSANDPKRTCRLLNPMAGISEARAA